MSLLIFFIEPSLYSPMAGRFYVMWGKFDYFIICIAVNNGSMIIGTQWLVEKKSFPFFTYVHKFMYM